MNGRFKFVVVTSSTCLVILLLLGAMHGRSASPDDPYRHLAVFTEVLSRIKSDYVEEPDMKNVTVGAINGLLESIDPYASYLNADQYKQYLKEKDAKKAGVGVILAKRFGYLSVVDSIPGSPAAKAGLGTTDVIETINGVSTRDMPLAFADLLLKGDPDSTVEVSVLHFRKPEPQKVKMTRAVITYPAVTAKMDGENGVITASSLEGARVKEVAAKVKELQSQGAKKLILDLRHCASGAPEDGVVLANLFLEKGLITYAQGQKVARQDFQAQAGSMVSKLPLAVIVNRGTAGAAEIAASALLDNQRAYVVGERTFGDAAIRKTITMDDGGAVILSVAKYYSPVTAKAIQDNGVTPSSQVQDAEPQVEQDEDNPAPEAPKSTEDLLMKKAIEVLASGQPIMS